MKTILLLAIALLTVSAFAQTKSVSVLENGDFDTDASGWSLNINNTNAAAASLSQTSIDGRSVLEISITNAGLNGGEIKLFSSNVTLQAGDNTLANEQFSTLFSFDAKFVPDAGATVPFSTRLWQKSVATQKASTVELGDNNSGWVSYSKPYNVAFINDGTANSRTFFIEVNLGNKGTGKIYLDNVKYEVTNIVDNATAIGDIKGMDIKVWSNNRAINISNQAGQAGMATVYDLGGRQVKQVQISAEMNTINIPHGGLYIVKSEIGNEVYTNKVVVK
ncbi:T9SS type A sorting domain-containing protein [Carboxylicivirga marina]|uniref:T9SS type A sorting domain-containing protein n=1 Tax=Carboxylicivirga marina TaxID=2800988 RepID=UPI00259422FE|nr:T9SS type A sorting domain-containing protein [uncultured Carboxylicivirga sp.]